MSELRELPNIDPALFDRPSLDRFSNIATSTHPRRIGYRGGMGIPLTIPCFSRSSLCTSCWDRRARSQASLYLLLREIRAMVSS